jgi:adenylylsulfate kinase
MSLPMPGQASTSQLASGAVIWVTGLAGTGKSTVAALAGERLAARGRRPILLDGDVLRDVLGGQLGYQPEARRALAERYARLAKELAAQGFDVICATISMFHAVQAWNRANIPG